MAINIENREVERAVRLLADRLGIDPVQAIGLAVRNELVRDQSAIAAKHSAMRDARRRVSELRDLDPRTSDEILGYDESGLPR